MMFDTRYAVYAVPQLNSPLKLLADAWLGRDPDIDGPAPHPIIEEIPAERLLELTMAPRHYGFHGTLKAPFFLAEGEEAGALQDFAGSFALGQTPFTVPLKLDSLDGFLALVPAEPAPELEALAADCVRDFDRFRAPLAQEERQRRHPDRLSVEERANLDRWGYPYVLDSFRFHMTLTDRLEDAERAAVRAVLERILAPALAEPLLIDQIALFTQTHKVAPFRVVDRFRFG